MAASDQQIAAALTRLRASAAQTREALRDLPRGFDKHDLSMTFSKLATVDGLLGELMAIEQGAETKERRRATKKVKPTKTGEA